jgi:hypothetical protein
LVGFGYPGKLSGPDRAMPGAAMSEVGRQMGLTIRKAIESWGATAWLCTLIAVIAAALIAYRAVGG